VYRKVMKAIQGEIHKDIINGTSITSLLFMGSLYLPIIGLFCTWLIPLPVLFYRSKLGRKTGAIIPGLSFMIMMIFLGGSSMDIVLFAELLLLGFVLSEFIEANLSIEKTLLYACSIIFLTGTIGILFYGIMTQKGILVLISEYISKNWEFTMALYEKMGVSEQHIQLMSEYMDQLFYIMIRIVPALIFSGILFMAWTILLFAKPMMISRMLYFPDFGSLSLWKAPDHLVWGVIGCGAFLLLSDGLIYTLGLNGLIILMVIYFFQGIAIVAFYFNKLGFPRIVRIALYGLIAIQQIALLMIVGIGFFDMWLNIRQLGKEENS